MTPIDPAALSFVETHLAPLAGQTARRRYKRGQCIVLRGEILLESFMIARGCAVAKYALPAASAPGMTLGPGDFFGEEALAPESFSRALIRADDEDTVVLSFPAPSLKALLGINPLLKQTLAAQVSARYGRMRGAGGPGSPLKLAFN